MKNVKHRSIVEKPKTCGSNVNNENKAEIWLNVRIFLTESKIVNFNVDIELKQFHFELPQFCSLFRITVVSLLDNKMI